MNFSPLIANFSWDDVLYFLIPLIWALQYFLPGNKKGEEAPPEDRQSESDAAERMRRVREEIRRRIEAQREGRPAVEEATVAEEPATPRQARPTPMQAAEPVPQSTRREPEREFVAPSRAEQLQIRLEEQRARLAESKRVKEDVLRNAKRRRSAIMAGKPEPKFGLRAGDLRSQVLSTLESPLAARKAIVLSEILGEPRATKPYR